MLAARTGDVPILFEVPMNEVGKVWKGEFKLDDEKARVLLLRFVSGDQKDDNGENAWLTIVCGANGVPLEGAHLTKGSILRVGSLVDFKVTKDLEAGKAAIAKERELYPDNCAATFWQWANMMREKPGDETKAKVTRELEKLYAGTKKQDVGFAYWFEQVGMKERAEEVRKAVAAADPKVAESARFSELLKEKDVVKRIDGIERFIAALSKENRDRESYQTTLLNILIDAKQYEKAYAFLETLPNKDFNAIAWPLIEKGQQLEKATGWAKRGVDLVRKRDPSSKPPYFSMAAWKKSNEYALSMVLDTYGFGLMQQGKMKEAEPVMAEAYALSKGKNENVNARMLETYLKNGKYENAIAVGEECLQNRKANDKLIEGYKTAYVKVKGSNAGFDAINHARAAAKADLMKDILKGMVNKPAIDFSLRNIDGKTIKLSELRGKVVVVDFWATWCAPCKASFPYLQKVYDKYKTNPKVVILALNTGESEDLVKKFMADNKYTFPVLYDQGFMEKYGVEGIPTKFVIDKKGMIQFRSIGFSSGDKMIQEMTMQLEMLLDDKFYSSLK